MKVFYIGPFFVGSTVNYRVNGLRQLGLDVYPFNTDRYYPTQRRGIHNLWHRLCWGPPGWRLNADLLHEAEWVRPDIIIIDKGLMIHPDTLRKLKSANTILIHYSHDDQFNPANQSRHYLDGIPLYDLHITTKSYNVEELRQAGATKVVYQDINGFDPSVFYPREVSPIDRKRLGSRVGFIGGWEKERAKSILYLAQHGISVRVWGPGWKGQRGLNHPALKIEGKGLWGEDYPLAICATDINLCFLRKINRDLQTSRSIEIPACGGFMLAERSDEHRRLFDEDKEAVFFSSNDELLEKVHYYIEHADELRKISEDGRERCHTGGYNYAKRFESLIQFKNSLCPVKAPSKKILYKGPVFLGSTVNYRVNGLRQLGFDVYCFNTDRYFPTQRCGIHNLWHRLCWGPPVWRLNADLLREAEWVRPDIIMIDKGLMIHPDTLRKLKSLKTILIHYSHDDQFNPANQSRYYLAGIPLYDVQITTKTYNVLELRQVGASAVVFQDNGYDPSVFYPRDVSPLDHQRLGAQVGFIGEWEGERAKSILLLARNGIPVRVWGPGWEGHRELNHPALKIEGRGLWGEDYPLAICATDISLCFLRKINRDLQTTRSIEIPGCGGFMLAERSDEHRRLFDEDKEAVFFSSNDELLEKVHYYIEHADERRKIAAAGRQRCQSGGYSFEERFRWLIQDTTLRLDGVGKKTDIP